MVVEQLQTEITLLHSWVAALTLQLASQTTPLPALPQGEPQSTLPTAPCHHMLFDHPFFPTGLCIALAETSHIHTTFIPEDADFVFTSQFVKAGSSLWEFYAFNSNNDLYVSPTYDDVPEASLHIELDSSS
jgi:hypothetical protein